MITRTVDHNIENRLLFQGSEWQHQMKELGIVLADNHVRHVFFSHGTFAGDDPLGINTLIEHLSSSHKAPQQLKQFTKKSIDYLVDDSGNFTQEYISSFAKATGNHIKSEAFIWSGGNYHSARLFSAVQLCNTLARVAYNYDTNDHILLIGHSHAGQIFALLSTLLANTEKSVELITTLGALSSIDINQLEKDLETIKNITLDIVTMGTPVRYKWGCSNNYRLMNIINDRANHVDIDGLLSTRDGDYVQQWATEGTDMLVYTDSELNKRLDQILLNKGRFSSTDLKQAFMAKLNNKKRREPVDYNDKPITETFLIDYRDQRTPLRLNWFKDFDFTPHCIKTLFGHGVYTRKEMMLFNTKLMVEKFFYTKHG